MIPRSREQGWIFLTPADCQRLREGALSRERLPCACAALFHIPRGSGPRPRISWRSAL